MPVGYTHWAKTANEAIDILKTGQVFSCSLDHDLGGEETGHTVAKWIEEQAHMGVLKPIKCSVHSQNAVGAANMKAALRSAQRAWNKN